MARVTLLTNFLPPYRIPLLEDLSDRLEELRVLVSVEMEQDRDWMVDWGKLDVTVSRTFTLPWVRRHPLGFDERREVHVPYDTFFRLVQWSPDVVVSGELGVRSVLAVVYRSLWRRSRLVLWLTLSEHTERGLDPVRRFIRRRLLRRADAVFVNGASGARYASANGVPRDRISTIPYTAATPSSSERSPWPSPDHAAPRLLYAGHLIERKGLGPLLAALDAWATDHPERQVELWLVGDGPLRERLGATARAPNLDLVFHGSVPPVKVQELLAAATFLVFPTLADEWGLVVNEALASGVPVLGSRYSQAVEELVRDGETGWTFRPDHHDEIRRALDAAFDVSPADLARMRSASRSSVEGLTPDRVATSMADSIRHLVAGA